MDKVCMNDGSVLKLVRVGDVKFDMKTQAEREATINRFGKLLDDLGKDKPAVA